MSLFNKVKAVNNICHEVGLHIEYSQMKRSLIAEINSSTLRIERETRKRQHLIKQASELFPDIIQEQRI